MNLENMSIEEIEKELDVLFEAKDYLKVIEIVEELPKNRWNSEIVGLIAASYNNAEEYQKAIDCLNENVDLCKEEMYGWHYRYAYATYWLDLYQETLEHALKAFEAAKCDVELEGKYNQIEDMAGYSVRQINKKQIGDDAFREYANELFKKIEQLYKAIEAEIRWKKMELVSPKERFIMYVENLTYKRDDSKLFEKLVNETKDKFSKEEQVEVLLLLSEHQRIEEMALWLEKTKMSCTLKVATRCMKTNCYGNFRIEISDVFYNMTDMFVHGLSKSSGGKLLFEVVCLAIDSIAIHLFEKLVSRMDFPVLDESQIEIIHKHISKVNDRKARAYFEYYMENGVIKQSYEYYYDNGLYISKVPSKEYYEYDAWNNCQYYLKEYGKKKLLDPETTKRRLWNFLEQTYNWDDGVDIPYFVLQHPNCDLELKKWILAQFDEEYYPLERIKEEAETNTEVYFVDYLRQMIKDEEAGNKERE